jgi:hypothetical protein
MGASSCSNSFVSNHIPHHTHTVLFFTDALAVMMQDLPNQYVRNHCSQFVFELNVQDSLLDYFFMQLVCFYYVLTTFTTVGYGKLELPVLI